MQTASATSFLKTWYARAFMTSLQHSTNVTHRGLEVATRRQKSLLHDSVTKWCYRAKAEQWNRSAQRCFAEAREKRIKAGVLKQFRQAAVIGRRLNKLKDLAERCAFAQSPYPPGRTGARPGLCPSQREASTSARGRGKLASTMWKAQLLLRSFERWAGHFSVPILANNRTS